MTTAPLISVIIPVYNCQRYLADAIRSVLDQNWQSLQVIIIDDGSTDGSAAVAAGFADKIHYHFQPNAGMGAARNAGVSLAQGDFFAFLDADDLWPSNRLAAQMAAFEANPALDMVFGRVRQFISPELVDQLAGKVAFAPETEAGYLASAMLVRRTSFERVGYFSTQRTIGEFVDWFLRAKEMRLESSIPPVVVLERRIHDANMGVRERKARNDYLHILKASLDRRRLAQENELRA